MRESRLIPIILLSNNGVYKSINFKNYTYIGDPINTIHLFNDMEVDELIILDIDASKNCFVPNYELIKEFSSEAFMPLSYGGGIKTTDQADKIFKCGVEKIILNHSILYNKTIITNFVEKFGSQSIVAAIDYKKNIFGKKYCFDYVSNSLTKINLNEAILETIEKGVGEIMLTSVDHEGIMKGYDIETISEIINKINIPLIVSGGAGTIHDFKILNSIGVKGIAAGSFFVYFGKEKGILINYPSELEIEKYIS
mgnify:CR=1 FL=1